MQLNNLLSATFCVGAVACVTYGFLDQPQPVSSTGSDVAVASTPSRPSPVTMPLKHQKLPDFKRSVVSIRGTMQRGTAWFISKGLLMTNKHVAHIAGGEVLVNGRRYPMQVIRTSKKYDLALVKTSAPGQPMSVCKNILDDGARLVVAGFPKFADGGMITGESAYDYSVLTEGFTGNEESQEQVQLEIPAVQPGHSGSPVYAPQYGCVAVTVASCYENSRNQCNGNAAGHDYMQMREFLKEGV